MLRNLTFKWMIWGLLVLSASLAGANAPQAADSSRSPHGSLNLPCQNCHTVYGWKPIRAVPEFDHNQTKFPLRGMHEGVNCVNCHTKMVFTNVGTKCADCHADIHRGKMAAACENCHTVRGWKVNVTQINMHMNRFPLTGAHAAAACDDCHKNGALAQFKNMSTECLSCHRKDFNSTTSPKHAMQTGFSTTPCQSCHTTNSWSDAKFDHAAFGFPLSGQHAVPPRLCADCHNASTGGFNIADTACQTCHQNDYNHAHLQMQQLFPIGECQACHTNFASWTPANFDHSKTPFPLTGSHTVPPRACTDCHVNNNYNITATACASCHLPDFNKTTNPNHVQGGFPQTCETCHTTTAWQPANFDHSKTNFPLTGAHTVPPRQCADCHVNNNYNITNTACVSCHQTDFNNAKTPVDHIGANFPTTCANCHDTIAWTDGKFDHSSTGWALTGMHTVPPRVCTDCHVNGNYNLSSTTCVTCHQKDYNNTNNPNHAQQGIATTCEICHTTSAWQPAQFDHSKSGFPLTGAHTVPPRACTDCHVNNNYNITNTACVSCHQTDYNNAKTPVDHVGANFPTTCAACHDTVVWTDGKFDHSSTGWTLTGAHTVPPRVCTDCHVNGNYNITTTTCVSCHQTDFNNAKTPVDHVGAKFPTTCETCHDTVKWADGKFDHSSTGWTLTGAHTVPPRACADCHVNGNYNITTTTCVSCHQTDYNNALTPVNHPKANFPLTCDTCHDTIVWTDGKFDHASTGWALTGSHTVPPRQCIDCHVNGNYSLTSTTCVTCHQTDYNNATTPVNHVAAKFPTTCEGCHDTVQWSDGTFNHATTGWALTGSHTVPPRACADCHVSGNYNLTSTACVTCHQNDYNTATSPVNHITANFPTTCETCHDTIVWTDGKFDHSTTGWALVGSHTVPPRACTDCHVNNNYKLASTACVTCHQTDYNNTNNPPHASVGFPTTCDVCHDMIAWTDATFDHSKTAFPLTGAHTVPPRACTDCHVNNNYTTLPTTCYGCHATDYNNTTNPNHKAAGFPTTCNTCHTTTTWSGATFNHTWFPTNHGNANGVCSTCHTNPNDYSVFQCTGCHTKSNTDNQHQGVNGYVYNSTNCYQCHKNGGGG